MRLEYTAEIIPNSEAPIKNHKYEKAWCEDKQKEFKYKDTFHGVDIERPKRPKLFRQAAVAMKSSMSIPDAVLATEPLPKKKSEHKVVISVEVNGRTIAQRTEKVPPPPYMFEPRTPRGFRNSLNEKIVEDYLGDDAGDDVDGV